jgi:uncharacterized Tic20 family protein
MEPLKPGQSVGSYVAGDGLGGGLGGGVAGRGGGPLTGPVAPTQDERFLGMMAHLGAIAALFVTGGFLGWAVPLFLMIAKKDSAYIRTHAVEALNFQISMAIAAAVGWVLVLSIIGLCVGVPVLLAAAAAGVIFPLLGGLKANEGQLYRYPFNVRLVK